MTIQAFCDKYNLHDSLLESIKYDAANKTLRLIVNLCLWAQDEYAESADGAQENEMIQIEFSHVTDVDLPDATPNGDSILTVKSILGGVLDIVAFNDDIDDVYLLRIYGEEVSVQKVEALND